MVVTPPPDGNADGYTGEVLLPEHATNPAATNTLSPKLAILCIYHSKVQAAWGTNTR